MLLNAVLRLSGVLLKLCRFILGCAKKCYLFGYSQGNSVFSNLLGLPEGLIAFLKMIADLLWVPKKPSRNFAYHERAHIRSFERVNLSMEV